MGHKRLIGFLAALLLLLTGVFAACRNAEPPDSGTLAPGPGNQGEEIPSPTPDPDVTPSPELPEEPETPPIEYDILIKAKTQGVNIRSGMSTGSPVVGGMDRNDMVTYLGKTGNWYVTVYRQKTAYVTADPRYTELAYFEKGDSRTENVLEHGKRLLGIPYELGAQRLHWGNGVMNASFTGATYDCSSLVQYIFFHGAGVFLEVTTRTQCVQGTSVKVGELKRGDVMFFTNDSRVNNTGIERIGHVGVYFGDNYILHTASDYAVIEPISDKRWSYLITVRDML